MVHMKLTQSLQKSCSSLIRTYYIVDKMAGYMQHHTRLSWKQNPFFNLMERQRKEMDKTETNFQQIETKGGIVRIVK